MGAGIAANPHYPEFALGFSASGHPRPLLLLSAARKTIRSGSRQRSPATVWSAPLRGPAAPEKPFIILSERLPKHTIFISDGLLFIRSCRLQLVGIAAFRDRLSVRFLVDPFRFNRAGLATSLPVPGVRRLCRPDELKLSRSGTRANKKARETARGCG